MSITDLIITETSIPSYNDLRVWVKDYKEVNKEFNKWIRATKGQELEEIVDYILAKMHNNNEFSICSDTSEPLEYIDFNYGSLACTISMYDRNIPELLPCFDGYIRRNGEELADCYMDLDIKEVQKILDK